MTHPAAIPTTRRASYADVLAAPPHMVAELVDGALRLQPRPRVRHANAASTLISALHGRFQRGEGGPGGWWLLVEPELHLGEDVVVPDIAGWRRERMAAPPDDAFIALAPDWVCEVLSPSTRSFDLTTKRALYGREGVGHLWLVDPDARTLEAFALGTDGWRLAGALAGEAEVALAPFAAAPFALGALWLPDQPSAAAPAASPEA